ncbi:MAG: Uncharacterized protein RSP_6119, partial [uncultured Friedmanniella sp.]
DRGQALPDVRPHDHLAQEVGAGLGRGPLLLAGLPARQARPDRRRTRDERAGAARRARPGRHHLPVGGRPGGRWRRLAAAHGARPSRRPASRRPRPGRDHPVGAGRRRLDREGPDPHPPQHDGM